MNIVATFYVLGLLGGYLIAYLFWMCIGTFKRERFERRFEAYLDTLSPADLHEYRKFMRSLKEQKGR